MALHPVKGFRRNIFPRLRARRTRGITSAMQRPVIGMIACVALLTAIAGHLYHIRIHRFWGITQTDFSVFYQAGYQIDRRASMYEQHPTHYTTNEEYLFKYAPPVGLAMIPLSRLPVQTAIRWWYVITAVAFIGALWGVFRLTVPAGLPAGRPAQRRHAAWIMGLLLLTVLRPYLANLRLGQIDVVLAGCLVAFLAALTRRRDALAGGWLGIPILCKLVPAIWLLYLVAARRWRTWSWTIVAMGGYLASPMPHLGVSGTWRVFLEWLETLKMAGGNYEWLVRYKNQSVLSAVLRVVGGARAESMTSTPVAVAGGITIALGLLYGWWVWRALRRDRDTADPLRRLIAPSLVMIAMVIFSPHAWIATFIHLLLPYGVVIAHLITRAPRDRIGWGLLAGSWLLVSATAPDLLGSARSQAVHLAAPLMWGAMCLAIGVWRVGNAKVSR